MAKNKAWNEKLYVRVLSALKKFSVPVGGTYIGGTALTPSAADLNQAKDVVSGVTFVIGAEAGNNINVGLQLNDADGNAMAVRSTLYAYLSDDANGDSIAGTAPSVGVAIGTDGLADPVTANKSFMLTSEADGDIDLDIGEAGVDTWYLVVVLPSGKLIASGAITFA